MAYDENLTDRIRRMFQEHRITFEDKKMMGGICFLVNDKMCLGVVKDKLMARIDPEVMDEALLKPGCREMDFTGKPMKGFVFVEPEGVDLDTDLDYWIELALEYNPKAKSSKKEKNVKSLEPVMKNKHKSPLHIRLRPWSILDLDILVKYANNKKIADNLTDAFPFPFSREDGIDFINRFKDYDPLRAFAIEVNGTPCGAISVFPQTDVHRKNAEMGYWLAEEYWGKGIMTEAVKQILDYAFRTFEINRIFARPYATNIASHRVLEKAGLKLEARFEKSIFKNGQYLDELIFSILR